MYMIASQKVKSIQKELQASRDSKRWFPIFSVLSDSTRFSIFQILSKHHDLCVTDLARICGLTVAAVSHQLKLLELSGLIERVRNGKMICYKVNNEEKNVEKIKKLIFSK
jgi:ArsR family transcriptional regulator, lead/cadmium/zinc/bismuth-responsive transcriptional repressor